jgi:hypothetical protein
MPMETFNNREVAAGIWFFLFGYWFIHKTKVDVFRLFKPVVKAALVKPIIISFFLLLTYSIGLVFLLDYLGLWKSYQIKNFIFWLMAVSGVYFSKLRDIESDPHYFSNALKSALKISVAFQFILTVYTFSFWIEFTLVPIATLSVIMGVFTKKKDKYYKVAKLSENVLGALGIILIGFTVYKLATDFGEFGKTKTFYDFVVPTALSVLILPFYYVLGMYCAYERIFIRMKFFIKDDTLLRYAKWRAFWAFHFRFFKLDKWAYSLGVHEVKNRGDVNQSLKRMFGALEHEEKNARVPFRKGWSPYQAPTYISSYGLKSNPYEEIEPGLWYASTPYLDLDDEIIPNNIAYYIEGDEEAAKKLILKLNINVPCHSEAAASKFIEIADKLCWQALSLKMPDDIKGAIENKKSIQTEVRSKKIIVSSSSFIRDGYDIRLSIEVS